MIQLNKKVLIIVLVLVVIALPAFIMENNRTDTFSDLSGHWAEEAVLELHQENIIDGFKDGTFRPNEPLLVDQFLTMLIRSFGIELKHTEGYWASSAITEAFRLDLVFDNEFANIQSFKNEISRSEMARLMYRAETIVGRTANGEGREWLYYGGITDLYLVNDVHQNYIVQTYIDGLLIGRPTGEFDPKASLSRSEGAVVISRFMNIAPRTSVDVEEISAKRIPVLMYHHFVFDKENDGTNNAIVSIEDFEEQMQYLHKNNFTTITTEDLRQFMGMRKRLPKNAILITMDDGYQSNFDLALPILREHNFGATIFPITSSIGVQNNPHIIDRPSLVQMGRSVDVFEFQGHTHNLHFKRNDASILLVEDKEDIVEDLSKSNEILEQFNIVTAFAYPFGAFDQRLKHIVSNHYLMAFTTRKGFVEEGDDLFEINRFNVDNGMTLEQFSDMIRGLPLRNGPPLQPPQTLHRSSEGPTSH